MGSKLPKGQLFQDVGSSFYSALLCSVYLPSPFVTSATIGTFFFSLFIVSMPIDHENEVEYGKINQTFKHRTQKNFSLLQQQIPFFLITEL